ncbi:MAG: ferrous iron transport protein A [Eubacterium sp.]|nr:ferrous iron transport protein A [Eubacterium sp.]MDD7208505.1 FeoA family protein [Lachnospiraceae bacterium]MDY5497628.1 FeoA family protein [Anaerobutyricum sp.]
MTLAQLPVGKEGIIETVGGKGNLRCRFLDMGLIPGTKVRVLKTAPMGDPIQIRLRGYDITIRKEEGENITLKEGSVQ